MFLKLIFAYMYTIVLYNSFSYLSTDKSVPGCTCKKVSLYTSSTKTPLNLIGSAEVYGASTHSSAAK